MAIGKASDFKIYDDRVAAGFVETLVQVTDAFNAASRNSLRMVTKRLPGAYEQASFFQNITSLVTRRDVTSVAAATDLALTQEEFISVKCNRKIGPVAQTLDAFRKKGLAAGEGSLSFLIGSQVAKAVAVDQLNSGISAAAAALAAQATNFHDGSAGTVTNAMLVTALSKMGDSADRVVCWIMHSKVYYDLVKQQIADNIFGISNMVVAQASPVTMNRPVLVTDSLDLFTDATPDTYITLGLTQDAVRLEDSEEESLETQIVTGLENLVVRLQGEFAYNLHVKGFKWDTTNGGENPAAAAVATGSNWDKVVASYKDLGGVALKTQ
jgi:hypothetical protein